MAALHLIKTYSSDSDEDKHDEEKKDDKIIKQTKLILPASILSLNEDTYHEEVIDNPLDHNGRIRSFKHERGNWTSLVYIDCVISDCFHTWMKSILNELPVQGEIISNLHISLSRTLVLKFHWIESFVESLKLLCHRFHQFIVQLTDVKIYCNEERTRTFLGIYCQDESGTLKCLTEAIDYLLAEYQLPSFYKDISYHISFFWCLGDKQIYLKKFLPSLIYSLNKFLAENVEDTYVVVKEIQCKIGNKYYSFKLK